MILQKQKEANVLFEGETQQSIGMTLDLDSAQILMQMLSKNLYSDSIGSTIRETASITTRTSTCMSSRISILI